MMDMLDILINPNKVVDICGLCYKKSESTISLHDGIEIHDEYCDMNSTLWNILYNLFPSHEFLLTQICEDCSTLILKIFNLLQRNCIKNELISYYVDNLNQEIEEMDCKLFFNKKIGKCKLKISVPSTNSIIDSRKQIHYYQCKKCAMKFRSELVLKKHIQITHKNINNAIICDICGKIFSTNSKLKAHLGCHKQKQCPHCLRFFKSHSHFNLHVKRHLTPIKIKRNIRYKKCTYCDYESVSRTTLEAHINKYHLHIRPFSCEICQKSFYKKDNLSQHILTHNKIKDKTCDICGETFSLEKTLREHQRLHLGLKPYKCEICNIGFTTSGRRYEHVKRKHMEKNESCDICGKKFSLRKSLNTHLQSVHGSEFLKD